MSETTLNDYCSRNIYAAEWLRRKNELDAMIDVFVSNKTVSEPEINNYEFFVGEFSNMTNLILDNDGLRDWFKYYAERQLGIYYYALIEYKETKDIQRMVLCQEETRMNNKTVPTKSR